MCEEKKNTTTPSGGKTEKQPSLLDQVAKKKSLLAQCLMNGAIILLVTGSGMPIGFSAILLPQLQAPNSDIPTDDNWASWIASVHSIMSPLGSLLAGPLMDRLGRRCVLQLSSLPMVAGWFLIAIAPDLWWIAAGRMLAGFAVGMVPATSQVLIGEVSEPRLRGVFASSPNLSYALGILMVYTLGSIWPWRVVAALSSALPAAGLILMATLPESPVWLVNSGRVDKARKSLLWLRGGDQCKVNHELHLLVVHLKSQQDQEACQEQDTCHVLPEEITALKRPEVFKPFLIILIFSLLQILSGPYVVIFYGVNLISSASGCRDTDIHSLTVAVMTALVRFVVSIVTTVCLLRLGRRKIGIVSGIGTALACILLVTFLQMNDHGKIQIDGDLKIAIIATLIMIYVAMNTFGLFSLPCMMIGEVLPARVRGFVSGIFVTILNVIIFSTTKSYPFIASFLGPSGVFLTFAIVAVLATVYIYFFLPETRDRPLTQIENYFAVGKNYLWIRRDKSLIARKSTLHH
uniref:Major facilitator superfamily (MFS) profile domain-containing protein n=1 Tax=Homalodisca liturata TaxID=320908 RepID=A0A1B6H7X1_9HEMI